MITKYIRIKIKIIDQKQIVKLLNFGCGLQNIENILSK